MRKNISRIIVEVGAAVKPTTRGKFRVPCSEAHKYTNKILVDAIQHKPSGAEKYANEQMATYQVNNQTEKKEVTIRKETMRKKMEKPMDLNYQLTLLESKFNFLLLQDVMTRLMQATRKELEETRPKLIKLENNLSFNLESEELAPHLEQALIEFLEDLNEIINKTSKIY